MEGAHGAREEGAADGEEEGAGEHFDDWLGGLGAGGGL